MRRGLVLGLAATGLVVAAGAYALGPGAATLVESLADGRSVWRLGTLEVDGVQGAWIGDLTAASVRLSDDEGVWLEARNARVRWEPGALLMGRVQINEVVVPEAAMARRPALSAPPRSRGMDLSVTAPALRVQSLRLNEAVAGREALLELSAAVETRSGSLAALQVFAVRADAPTDRLAVQFAEGADRPWTVDGFGEAEGILAGLLGAQEPVTLVGEATATDAGGDGDLRLTIGEATALEAQGRWSEAGWEAQGSFDPSSAPLLPLADRLGGAGTFEARGDRDGALTARLAAPALEATVEGSWEGALQVSAESSAAHRILGLDDPIAERIMVEGVFQRNDQGGAFEGRAVAAGLQVAGFAGEAEGPVTVGFNRERITVSLEAAVRGGVDRFAVAAVDGALVYGRQSEALSIERLAVTGPAIAVEARGTPDQLSGSVRVTDLSVLSSEIAGGAAARFEAVREGEAWRITAEGAGDRVRADDPYGELLGARPQLQFAGVADGGGVTIQRATVIGPRLRLGVRGRASGDALDLGWEASGRGPITVAGVGIVGAVDASGRVLGRPSAPRVTGVGELATLDLGALALSPAQVRFAYAEGAGTVSLTGLYGDQPFAAMGDVIVRDGTVAVEGLTADLAGLSAQGSLSVTSGSLAGSFDVQGPLAGLTGDAGSITARLGLSGTGEQPVLDGRGLVRGAQFGRAAVNEAAFAFSGPLEDLRLGATVQGAVSGTAFDLGATGTASVRDGTIGVVASIEGTAAGLPVRSVEPLQYQQRGAERRLAGIVAIGDGTADLQWAEEGGAFSASATVDRLSMAALSGLIGERVEGEVSGRAAIRSVGGRLVGDADLAATDFRVRGRMRSPIDLRLTGGLADETVTALVNASSEDGLQARVDLSAAVTTQAAPVRIAQAPGRSGRAAWEVQGPADAVWALVGTADQSVSGELSGSGEARFGPGILSGSGALSLRQGVLEDRFSGLRLQDVALDVRLADDAVTVDSLTASDGDGGRVSGSGSLQASGAGSLLVSLDNVRLINREDVTARADGGLEFRWDAGVSELSGDLTVTEATIRGAPTGDADIPTLDVIEINRPARSAVAAAVPVARRAGPPTILALRVRAPQRVFTRYRGVDTEWSLDLSVTGTTSAPELSGEARLLRGEAQVAGRPVEFSRGIVRFRGPPEDAELDIVAEQASADLTARVVITGTVGAPEISLENDQGLPEDEVLPLLLFGATQAELSPLQAAQLAATLSSLAGRSAFDLVDLTRRIAGLDRFDVRQEEEGILVAGGRYLTRQVYLELARNGLGEAQTRVEWFLTPDLTLITSFADDGEQRVSLRWREEDETR